MKTAVRCLAALYVIVAAGTVAGGELLDPTRPLDARSKPASADAALQLEAVMHAAGRAIAIIGGRVVRVGDHVGSARIDEILPDRVRYTRFGHSYLARLKDDSLSVRRDGD